MILSVADLSDDDAITMVSISALKVERSSSHLDIYLFQIRLQEVITGAFWFCSAILCYLSLIYFSTISRVDKLCVTSLTPNFKDVLQLFC